MHKNCTWNLTRCTYLLSTVQSRSTSSWILMSRRSRCFRFQRQARSGVRMWRHQSSTVLCQHKQKLTAVQRGSLDSNYFRQCLHFGKWPVCVPMTIKKNVIVLTWAEITVVFILHVVSRRVPKVKLLSVSKVMSNYINVTLLILAIHVHIQVHRRVMAQIGIFQISHWMFVREERCLTVHWNIPLHNFDDGT